MAIELLGDGGNVEFVRPLIGDRTTFTIEFWIKPTWPPISQAPITGRNPIYVESYDQGGQYNGATHNFVLIGSDDPVDPNDALGATTLAQYPPPGISTSPYTSPLVEDVWQHVAYVQNGSAMRIYVDGILAAQGTAMVYTGPQANHFHVGLRVNPVSGNEWGRFTLDELRVSSVARYTTNFVPSAVFQPDADTLSLWHFDEEIGAAATDATGTEPDATLSPTVMRVLADR